MYVHVCVCQVWPHKSIPSNGTLQISDNYRAGCGKGELKGIAQPKNENSVIIFSASRLYKPMEAFFRHVIYNKKKVIGTFILQFIVFLFNSQLQKFISHIIFWGGKLAITRKKNLNYAMKNHNYLFFFFILDWQKQASIEALKLEKGIYEEYKQKMTTLK